MGWIEELKNSETKEQEQSRIDAALKLRNDRMFGENAPESWNGLIEQVKADCRQLGERCTFTYESDGAFMLLGNGSPIRRSVVKFMPIGRYLRIAKTYSYDGITVLPDEVEKIRLELQPDDSVAFWIGTREKYRLVEQVSRYLITQVIRGRHEPEREREI